MNPIALIIEDDSSSRAALAVRLESFGHDCEAVGSQSEAKNRIERRGFTYILLDLEMPNRFGRLPSIPTGKYVLRDIRSGAGTKRRERCCQRVSKRIYQPSGGERHRRLR